MEKSTETVDCGTSKVPVWIMSRGNKMVFDRPAHIDEDGGASMDQMRDDECLVAPGAIYRIAN